MRRPALRLSDAERHAPFDLTGLNAARFQTTVGGGNTMVAVISESKDGRNRRLLPGPPQ